MLPFSELYIVQKPKPCMILDQCQPVWGKCGVSMDPFGGGGSARGVAFELHFDFTVLWRQAFFHVWRPMFGVGSQDLHMPSKATFRGAGLYTGWRLGKPASLGTCFGNAETWSAPITKPFLYRNCQEKKEGLCNPVRECRGLNNEAISWSQLPTTATVSHTSNIHRHDMGVFCRPIR